MGLPVVGAGVAGGGDVELALDGEHTVDAPHVKVAVDLVLGVQIHHDLVLARLTVVRVARERVVELRPLDRRVLARRELLGHGLAAGHVRVVGLDRSPGLLDRSRSRLGNLHVVVFGAVAHDDHVAGVHIYQLVLTCIGILEGATDARDGNAHASVFRLFFRIARRGVDVAHVGVDRRLGRPVIDLIHGGHVGSEVLLGDGHLGGTRLGSVAGRGHVVIHAVGTCVRELYGHGRADQRVVRFSELLGGVVHLGPVVRFDIHGYAVGQPVVGAGVAGGGDVELGTGDRDLHVLGRQAVVVVARHRHGNVSGADPLDRQRAGLGVHLDWRFDGLSEEVGRTLLDGVADLAHRVFLFARHLGDDLGTLASLPEGDGHVVGLDGRPRLGCDVHGDQGCHVLVVGVLGNGDLHCHASLARLAGYQPAGKLLVELAAIHLVFVLTEREADL